MLFIASPHLLSIRPLIKTGGNTNAQDAAATEFLDDAVMGNGLFEHGAQTWYAGCENKSMTAIFCSTGFRLPADARVLKVSS
jgi:hypothetical protein